MTEQGPLHDFKINHVIGGAQKSGTTALHRALRATPGLLMSSPKETHIFDSNVIFSTPQTSEDITRLYGRFFSKPLGGKTPVEATPSYMWHAQAVARIHQYNPEMKWIICLRNPISRCFSQWRMQTRNGLEKRSFWECIETANQTLSTTPIQSDTKPADQVGLLSRGLYTDQLQRLLAFFDESRVQLLLSANMRNDTPKAIEISTDFILKGKVEPPRDIPRNVYSHDLQMPQDCADFLTDFYAEEIGNLSEFLKVDLSGWLLDPMSF